MGEDDCAEQGEVTNSRFAGGQSSHIRDARRTLPTLCHPLSCPVNDTLKVNSEKNTQTTALTLVV